jgi:hypothetical protein
MSRQRIVRRRLSVPPQSGPAPISAVPTSEVRRTRRHLSEQPLVVTLIEAFDHAATGTITFVDPSGCDHALRLLHGVPAGAETRREIAPLGGILRSMGLSDEETLEVRLASGSRYDMLTARSLAIRGKLPEDVLREALRVQLFERVRMLLGLSGDTLYSCHPGCNLLSSFHQREPIECSEAEFLQLIAEGVRVKRLELPVARTLRLLKDVPLHLREDAPVAVLGLTDEESLVVDMLNVEALTARELVARDLAPRGVTGIIVYLFSVLRFFELPGENRPPVGTKRRCRSGVVRRG